MKPRIARTEETQDIREALRATGRYDWDRLEDMIPQDVVIREGYMSDGPGFTGKLAWIVHGEPGINTVLGKASNAAWRIVGESFGEAGLERLADIQFLADAARDLRDIMQSDIDRVQDPDPNQVKDVERIDAVLSRIGL